MQRWKEALWELEQMETTGPRRSFVPSMKFPLFNYSKFFQVGSILLVSSETLQETFDHPPQPEALAVDSGCDSRETRPQAESSEFTWLQWAQISPWLHPKVQEMCEWKWRVTLWGFKVKIHLSAGLLLVRYKEAFLVHLLRQNSQFLVLYQTRHWSRNRNKKQTLILLHPPPVPTFHRVCFQRLHCSKTF